MKPIKFLILLNFLLIISIVLLFGKGVALSPTILADECGCQGASETYVCGDTIYESCMMNCNLAGKGSCFTIGADDIVVDGAGFKIIGNREGYGIYNERNNIIIKNFLITNFEIGIKVNGDNNDIINNLFFDYLGYAIWIRDSQNNVIRNNNFSLNAVPGAGVAIFILNTENTVIESNDIITLDDGGYGISSCNSLNNKISHNKISTYGILAHAVQYGDTDLSTFYNNTVKTYGRVSNVIYNTYNSNHNLFVLNEIVANNRDQSVAFWFEGENNTLVSSTLNSYGENDDIRQTTDSGNNFLLNVSFDKDKTDIQAGNIFVRWYMDVFVKQRNGIPIEDATVRGYDRNNILTFIDMTGSNGYISRKILTGYSENNTGKTYFSPYTLRATKQGYFPVIAFVNLTGNAIGQDEIVLTLMKRNLAQTEK